MMTRGIHPLPEPIRREFDRAIRLEWWTIFFLSTIIVVMYLSMGGSQAMKTAWIEDCLSLIPPIIYLIAQRYVSRRPNERFPYGYQRVVSIIFLGAAVSLSILGLFLLFDALRSLLQAEHPSIGLMSIFGHEIWAGWVMMAALLYSVIPPVILGRKKLSVAKKIHQKALHTDADMNRADWMTAAAGIVGIAGVGFGLWWADSAAAAFISLDIMKDGVSNLRQSIVDLMDGRPTTVGDRKPDPLVDAVCHRLESLDWIEEVGVRMREEGHLLVGEIFIVPRTLENLPERLSDAVDVAQGVDWRIGDLVPTVVDSLSRGDHDVESQVEASDRHPV